MQPIRTVDLPPELANKLNKHNVQLEQLAEVLDVTRLDKQNELVRRLVRKQQDGTLGETTMEPEDANSNGGGDASEGDAMQDDNSDDGESDRVNFGDSHYYNVTDAAPAAPQPANTPAPSPSPPKPSGLAKSAWPLVLASALGGGGLGAAAMAIPAMLKDDPAPNVHVPATSDTDTQYQLEFTDEPAESRRPAPDVRGG